MDWLNYHHLLYFWTVAREGSIAQASRELHLTPQTISAQIRTLEANLGVTLFDRRGQRLHLTDTGRFVNDYAEEIFGLGRDLMHALHKRPTGRPVKLVVGVVDALPKLVVHRLLQPALRIEPRVHLVVQEGSPEVLLTQLAVHKLDVVLSDAPIPPMVKIKAYNHQLGTCGVALLAAPNVAAALDGDLPGCLHQTPMVLPTQDTTLRRSLEHYFSQHQIAPQVVAELADSALLKVFGQHGAGVFAVPELVADVVCAQYQVQRVGVLAGLVEQFFAITVARKITHPAVVAISGAAELVEAG